MKKESKDEIWLNEKIVSNNIKQRRVHLGFTQQEVAREIGVSIQQLQKYEKGINRISSGKLKKLASFYKMPISQFFYSEYLTDTKNLYVSKTHEKQTLALIKAFNSIRDNNFKNYIVKFVSFLSNI